MNKLPILVGWLLLMACESAPESTVPDTVATPKQSATRFLQPQAEPGGGASDEAIPSGTAPDPTAPPPPPETAARQIIRNAQLRFRVSDFAVSGRAVAQSVRRAGGQITYANESRTGSAIENELVVRIPAGRLDAFTAEVLNQSIFTDTKTVTTEDVTRRYVDVEARIRSKRATEETYLRLLKQARSVEDVLKVEEQLSHIREEREVQEAELRQLKNEVALSTVNLTYYQETEAALRPEEPFYTQIAHNLADGFRLVGSALIGVFYLLPLGIITALLIWLVIRWRNRRRQA